MEIAHRDLDLLIGKGQSMMEAARTAIEMVRTRLEQSRQEREQKIAKFIGILGVIFAVFQVFDPKLAQAILDWLNAPWAMPIESYSRAIQWWVQVIIAGGFTFMIWLYRRWR